MFASKLLYIAEHIYVSLPEAKYGGYTTSLMVNPATDLQMSLIQCTKCGGLMRDPYLSDSGYKCKTCLTENEDAKPAEANKQMIAATPLNCPFIDNGCKWSGPLSDLYEHLESICEMMPVQCGLQCGAKFPRSNYHLHVNYECPRREIKCSHCSLVVVCSMLDDHLTICSNLEVSCPNSCGINAIKQSDLIYHLERSCALSHISCPYKKYGCKSSSFPRSYLETHILDSVAYHLSLLANRIEKVEFLLSSKHTGGVMWKIEDVTEKIRNKKRVESPCFYTGLYKFQGRVVMDDRNSNTMGIYLKIVDGEWDDELVWPFTGKVTFTLISHKLGEKKSINFQFSTDSHPHYFMKPNGSRDAGKDGLGYKQFANHNLLLNDRYIKGDSISLRILVEASMPIDSHLAQPIPI